MSKSGQYIKKIAVAVGLVTVLMSVFLCPAVAGKKTVLILSSDEFEVNDIADLLYRDVVAHISKHIQQAGFQTTQSTKLGGAGDQPSLERGDGQLLFELREGNKLKTDTEKIDFVAIVQILADMVLMEGGTKINVEIRGRMLRVDNNDVLARFSLPVPNFFVAPPSCDRNCVIELLHSNTALIADGLGRVLGQRLKKGN